MASSNAPIVKLDRVTLTQTQLKTTEIVLYQMADIVDRLMAASPQYTKVEIPNGGQ